MAVVAIFTVILVAAVPLGPASAEVTPDYDIPNGHFYTQSNGAPGVEPTGYAVTDDGRVPMWREFQRLGGVAGLGYPISRRFTWDGFSVQAFQKGVLQWHPEANQAWLLNVFDLLHDRGKDGWLFNFRSTPPPVSADFDGGKDWPGVVAGRLSILNDNPAIKQRYFAAADPMTFFGLPLSRIADNGNHYAVRLQRAVIQQWKVDTAWAKAGQVTVANGGDVAKEAGLLPQDGVATELPPWGAGRVILIDAGHGGAEIGAAYRFADGATILEKDLNLRVALKVADLLTRAGYKPVLTRSSDSEVNKPPKLLTGKLPIGLDDELQARVDIANNSKAALFLSIHFNGHPDSKLRGSEVYYCKERPFGAASRRFADLLLSNLVRGLASIGYKDDDSAVKDDSQALRPGEHFYLLGPASNIISRPSAMPAALAEALFVTNNLDATNLRADRTLDVIARSYATAIHQYFAGSGQAQLPGGTLSPAPSRTPPTPTPTATATALPTPSPTATPKATPTPPAIGQGTIATDYGGGAALRAKASTAAPALGTVPNGTSVDILQALDGQAVQVGDSRWYRVRYGSLEGFIYAALVVRPGDATKPPLSPTATIHQGVITADGGAQLRATPSTSSDVVRTIDNGSTVYILATVQGEAVTSGEAQWYRVRFGDAVGFVYSPLVAVSTPPKPPSLGAGTVIADSGAQLRSVPATGGDVLKSLAPGYQLELIQLVSGQAVLAGDDRWYLVRFDGAQGYVYAQLIQRG